MNKQTVFEVLYDDKRNIKMVEDSINEIRAESFHMTYQAQKSLIDLRRFDFKFEEFKFNRAFNTVNSYKLIANIDGNFIEHNKRAEFRTSKFYNKELTLKTIHENPDVFFNTALVFIDGVLYEDISLLCREDITQIIINYKVFESMDGLTKDIITDLYERNVDVSVFFIKNYNIETFNTNIHAIDKIKNTNNGNIPISYFKNINRLELQKKKLCFVNTDDVLNSKVFHNISIKEDSIIIEDFETEGVYKTISLYNMLHIDSIITLNQNEEYFEIPIHDTPICTENMLIFREVDGRYLFAHDVKVDLYYPNIYKVDGNKDKLSIIVFYFDDTLSITSKHKNELKLYHRFINNIIDEYRNNTIADKIKYYKPISFRYDFKDYWEYEKHPDHLDYKIQKLKSLIKKNAEYYTKYLERLIGYIPTFYVDVSKIDLESKIRMDNHEETDDISIQEVFKEPRYLFIFRNDFSGAISNVSIFIDGLYYYPDITHKDSKYRFVYIPCRLIRDNSIIEIEKKYDHSYRKSISNIQPIEYEIKCENRFSINSIFCVDTNTKGYVPDDMFTLYRKNSNMDSVVIDKDKFYTYDKVYIKFHEDMMGKNIQILSAVNNLDLLTHDYKVRFNLMLQNDVSNIRMYKNGFHIPSSSYNIHFGDEFDHNHLLGVKYIIEKNDDLVINLGSYKYRLIYKADSISSNGYVDLAGKIDKPINLKWHDIYLNGIKLTKYDLDILTAFKFIIRDRGTTKNLVVYEKNLFGIGNGLDINDIPEFSSPEDDLFDDTIKDIITGEIPDIENILPDISEDTLEMIDIIFKDVLKEIGFINPNINQIVGEYLKIAKEALNENNDMFLDPDNKMGNKRFMFLDPDKEESITLEGK